MKYNTLVLCALLGCTQAIKDYVYDDDTQYDSDEIRTFMAKYTPKVEKPKQ